MTDKPCLPLKENDTQTAVLKRYSYSCWNKNWEMEWMLWLGFTKEELQPPAGKQPKALNLILKALKREDGKTYLSFEKSV